MCIMAIAAVAAIGQAVAGYAQQQQATNDQNAYHEQNRRTAVAAAGDRYAAINAKAVADNKAASADLLDKQTKALKARATATNAAGEAGLSLSSLSVDALERDLLAQFGRQEDALQTNLEGKQAENRERAESTYNDTVSRINSVRKARNPSPLGMIASIGGSLAGMG